MLHVFTVLYIVRNKKIMKIICVVYNILTHDVQQWHVIKMNGISSHPGQTRAISHPVQTRPISS
jgi:hypothetical protein